MDKESKPNIDAMLAEKYCSRGAYLYQVAELYEISVPTLKKWISDIVEDLGDLSRKLTPNQVYKIFKHLDPPE